MTSRSDKNSQTSKRKRLNYPHYVLGVLFAVSVLNGLHYSLLAGAADVMSQELHLNIADIGYLSSAFILSFILSVIPLGIWSDRTKRKNVIALAVVVWSFATALVALTSNILVLFLSRMALGVGEAAYSPASAALISDYFSRARRARIMSYLAAADLIGLMAGTILGGVVAGLYYGAWRFAFLCAGIPGLALAAIAWRLREPLRNQADFAHNMAGHDLTRAMIYAYPTSLLIAGIIGIIGSRWMKADVAAAQRIDHMTHD